MPISLVQPIELEGPGGGRLLLPGLARQLLNQTFGVGAEAEQTLAIVDVTKFQELVLLTQLSGLAGTPTATTRAYFVDTKNRRYPATEGVGAAAAVVTHAQTANGGGRTAIAITDAAGLGAYVEITVQWSGGAAVAGTLEVEVHLK